MSELKTGRELERLEQEHARICGLPDGVVPASDMGYRERLDDWGFFHLTIPEAAEITAIDMWFSGDIPGVEEPDDFDGDITDPRLKGWLAAHIDKLAQQMLKSVYSGLLKPDLNYRDLDDSIIPEETYISYDRLYEWLECRQYSLGDAGAEWLGQQTDSESARVC